MIARVLLVWIAALCLSRPASGQLAHPDIVDEIERSYRQLEFQEAERLAERVLANYGAYTAGELTSVHTILALIAYNRNELDEARRQFTYALQLSPQLKLDPVLVPPKINEYFEQLKAELNPEEAGYPEIRYVLVRDQRLGAAMRSLVLPGWGQFYKGETVRGAVVFGAFGIAAGGFVLSQLKQNRAKDRYEDAIATLPAGELASLSDDYDRWRRARNAFGVGAGLIWLVGYVDALVTGEPQFHANGYSLYAEPSRVGLRLRF